MEPSTDDYKTAEIYWNEQHHVGFDELDTFEQYMIARTIAEARELLP